jgi:DMSO/TMAO reductase YedYZ molybdopterin-dependent catalytic subunit
LLTVRTFGAPGDEHRRVKSRGLLGALIGVLTAAVAVGVGEAVAAFVRPAASPIIAVGNALILLTPEDAKRTAIKNVGTNDKTYLILGIFVVLAVLGALIGDLALRKLWYGLAGIGVFAAFGTFCALYANASRGTDVIPTLVGAAVAAGVLVLLVRAVENAGDDDGGVDLAGRRTFLMASAATAGLAALTGFGGRAAQHARFDVNAERRKVALPKPVAGTSTVPNGVDLGKSGLPWATPNDDFYRIDTALSVPQIRPQDWELRIHGMVDKPLTLTYKELLKRPLIERWITLCCVSNDVGGPLVGNAYWLGARLADLLREAGVQSGSDQLVLSSSDGMTIGAPTKVVMDGRDALVAVGMNGTPLPVEHGFPARIVVPGLYGYVSACKWVVDIKATTFAAEQAYWVQGGWVPGDRETAINLESRIDTPRAGKTVTVGKSVAIAGVAWDQHVGVSKVEVQVNDDAWQSARLARVPSTDTWRQWVLPWTPPKAGTYRLRVRATDGKGVVQTYQGAEVFPSGATGWHTITVQAANP